MTYGLGAYDFVKNESPLIPGWDIVGHVAEVGPKVRRFQVGDNVFGTVNFPGHGRAYTEYVAAPADHLAHKPVGITFEEAVAATLAALTSWQILVHQAKLQPNQRVLIHGAAGGVGNYAVQIAHEFGAYVIGTASTSKRDFVLSLGADEYVDYNRCVSRIVCSQSM